MDKQQAKKVQARKEKRLMANITRAQSRRLRPHWNNLYPMPKTWHVLDRLIYDDAF